jgi:hypothetical protein
MPRIVTHRLGGRLVLVRPATVRRRRIAVVDLTVTRAPATRIGLHAALHICTLRDNIEALLQTTWAESHFGSWQGMAAGQQGGRRTERPRL